MKNQIGTFLFIRAIKGDNGIGFGRVKRPWPRRPGLPINVSPDIEVLDLDGSNIDPCQIITNHNYNVQVTVWNDGDHDCNSCIVDLYYIDIPSIKPSVATSTLIGNKVVAVYSHSKTEVNFPFNVDSTMAGHKQLFARAYSLITNDYPSDWVIFCSNEDRHIGERYIHIF